MDLNTIYRKFLQDLQLLYDKNEAAVITAMIFESLAGIQTHDFIKNPGIVLEQKLISELNTALKRLLAHTPVQYVTGNAWFLKKTFTVSPAVLIPRPETEELVLEVIHASGKKSKPSVIDIGTGSGCIAISIKTLLPASAVTAVDISGEALEIAKQNAVSNNAEVNFQQQDFLDPFKWDSMGKYDVIVSNPPYIPVDEKEKLEKNVADHEPGLALFTPAGQPLIFYEKIALFGKEHLKAAGKVLVEVHEDRANDVAGIFNKLGYDTSTKKDMFEKERIVIASHSRLP